MSDYTRSTASTINGVNAETQKIQTAVNSKMDKSGGAFTGTVDMNEQRLINLPNATDPSEAMPLGQATSILEGAESARDAAQQFAENAAASAEQAAVSESLAASALAQMNSFPVEGALAGALALPDSEVLIGGEQSGSLSKRLSNVITLEEIDPTVGSGGDDAPVFTAALAAAKSANKTVIGNGAKTYNLLSKVTGDYCKFDGNGCKINTNTVTAIEIWPTAAAAVTSLSVNFVLADRNKITVTNAAGMQRGQLISIVSNDSFHPDRTAYVRGIVSTIELISGNVIRLADAIPFTLTAAGSRVIAVEPVKFLFENAVIEGADVTTNSIGIDVSCSVNPKVNDVNFDKFGVSSFLARHCVNAIVDTCQTGQSYFVGTNQSYGFGTISSNGFKVINSKTYTGRHGFTTGANSTGLPGVLVGDDRGSPCFANISDNNDIFPEVGVSPPAGNGESGFDCHECTYDVTIINTRFNRFSIFADYIKVINSRILGATGEASYLGFRPATNPGEWLFEDTVFEGMGRIELKGIDPSFTGDAHIPSIKFVGCSSPNNGMFFRGLVTIGAYSGTNKIGEFVLDDTKLIFLQNLDNAKIQLDTFIMRNVRDNQRGHFSATGAITDFRVRLGVVQNCSLQAGFNALPFALMQNVLWENIDWKSNNGSFSARVSDDARVHISNTRLDFGSNSTSSLGITANGGGGRLYTVNSPYNVRTGDTTAGFASVVSV